MYTAVMDSLSQIASASPLSQEDLEEIEQFLTSSGVFTLETVRSQIAWFVRDLGIDNYYFLTTPVRDIARQILSLGTSELVARHGGDGVTIQLTSEDTHRATYVVEDEPRRVREVEARIEERYPSFRLESYRTGNLPDGGALRFYVATRPRYPQTSGADPRDDERPPFRASATTHFLDRSLPTTVERYRAVWESLNGRMAPVIRIMVKEDSGEQRIMVGLHGGTSRRILTSFTQLFATLSIPIHRRYIEPFRDNKYVLTFYTPPLDAPTVRVVQQELYAVAMLPTTAIADLFYQGSLSARETMYAVAAAAFSHQFVSELAEGYQLLRDAVNDNPEARGILASLKANLTKNTFSTARIAAAVTTHQTVVRRLFRHFASRFEPQDPTSTSQQAKEIREIFNRDVPYHRDRTILSYFLHFNDLVARTNFFASDNVALAFRMNNGFLDHEDYPDEPYGVYYLVGREFTGFHVRFRDIARGGIRIVQSRTADDWGRNVDTIFNENYNLAATQQRKNKDIPEAGSKGIVLLNPEFGRDPSAGDTAFRSYVDALLDLLVIDDQAREVLFLGPDEGSAGLMDWAALHARQRSYPFWKGFTTGKSLSLGGVPHDRYGMTTRSVHTYARLWLEKLGLAEEAVTKVQTGGPDGDLGSNEIMISRDRTVAIVDGSGVVYDPQGLNRAELHRLAERRETVAGFNRSLLSDAGFYVAVDDRDVTLPDGTAVANGEEFRNRFHLSPYMTADLFVPCGGRPSAINVANWSSLLREDGTPRVRAIVEGANLFVTQEARLRLEDKGVVVFKDASTNKGGVTSSSLEVYAGLALNDHDFTQLMGVPESGEESEFRRAYVTAIIERIEANAAAEFELLWTEHQEHGTPFTLISDQVSERINRITDAIGDSSFLKDPQIRTAVIGEYTPLPLLERVGLEGIMERVPEPYLDAIVASRIGSRFVYRWGLSATEVDFARYMEELRAEAP